MADARHPPPRSGIEVVRALFTAHDEGRIEDMLALVHPDVVWEPQTRPARSTYIGHAGTLAMVDDLRAALGVYRIDYDNVVELADGRILAQGDLVRKTPEGEVRGPRVECVVTLFDGLVIALDSSGRAT
jgi:ketosteroid isomerase-like protein